MVRQLTQCQWCGSLWPQPGRTRRRDGIWSIHRECSPSRRGTRTGWMPSECTNGRSCRCWCGTGGLSRLNTFYLKTISNQQKYNSMINAKCVLAEGWMILIFTSCSMFERKSEKSGACPSPTISATSILLIKRKLNSKSLLVEAILSKYNLNNHTCRRQSRSSKGGCPRRPHRAAACLHRSAHSACLGRRRTPMWSKFGTSDPLDLFDSISTIK